MKAPPDGAVVVNAEFVERMSAALALDDAAFALAYGDEKGTAVSAIAVAGIASNGAPAPA